MNSFDEKFKDFLKEGADGFRFGHYYLEGRLAHGGMAEVFIGRDLELGGESPPLVIKCILPDLAGNPDFLGMFLNEAQLAAQMEHPNIVKVVDFGEFEGLLYMAMEYVDGMDCWRFSRRGMPVGADRVPIAVYIASMVLEALQYAHTMTDVNGRKLGVVHRDLSPSNIYLGRNGSVKLGDFGIAEIKSSRYREIAYIPQGKFGYVSPEQLEGAELDNRSDIFAMGIVLAELLLGKKIFKGASQLSVLLEIREGRFDTLEQNADRVDPPLLDIIYRALAREPSDRFPSAASFKSQLLEYIGGRGGTSEQLAKYITLATESMNARSVTSNAAPLFRTPTSPYDGDESSQAPTDPTAISGFVSQGFDEIYSADETPVTMDPDHPQDAWTYELKLADDRTVGPFTFAQVMELIYRNEIDGHTLVSLNGSPYMSAEQLPELSRHIPAYTPTMDVNDANTPDKRGVLTVESPAETVLRLALASETGLLVCKRDQHRKEVYFQNGKPIYVSSNNSSELLGEYLVAKGRISRAELDMALEVLPSFDGHMGDTLIALGIISAIELFRSIGNQMRDRFLELLSWRQGIYEFYRNILARENAPEIPLDPFAFVCDGLIAFAQTVDTQATLKAMTDCVVSRSPRSEDILKRISPPEPIRHILWDLATSDTVGGLVGTLDDTQRPQDLVSALYLALETGLWVIEGGDPPPWRR